MENLYNDNAVRHGFFKVNPILIIIFMVVFIPVSVLTSICYFQTKVNNNLPTFFSSVIVTSDAEFEEEDISIGDKILIKKQENELAEQIGQIDLDNKILVAYFDAVAEETENGSPIRIGYLQYFGKDTNNEWVYGFVGNEKMIISDAIIGTYQTNNSIKIELVSFVSSNFGLVLLSLLPLGAIFVLLVLDIFEQRRIRETNQEIQWTLHPETKIEKKANKKLDKKKKEMTDTAKQSETQKIAEPEKIIQSEKTVQNEKIAEQQKMPAKPSAPAKQVAPAKPSQSQTAELPAKPALSQPSAQSETTIAQKTAISNMPAKPTKDAKIAKNIGQPAKPVAPAKPSATPQRPTAPQQKANTIPSKPVAPQKPNAPTKPSTPPKSNGVPQRPANLPPKK